MRFYKIPASSLLPTIMAGDWIVTLKFWSKENIKRRDLIVFPYPPEPSIDYIKRVIGLPGEKLEIRKDQVFINGDLLDEPYAGIDPIAVHEIKSIIKNLSSAGIGILITDHNVRDTLEITDRSYIIREGEIMASGSREELIQNTLARELYLGKDFRI